MRAFATTLGFSLSLGLWLCGRLSRRVLRWLRILREHSIDMIRRTVVFTATCATAIRIPSLLVECDRLGVRRVHVAEAQCAPSQTASNVGGEKLGEGRRAKLLAKLWEVLAKLWRSSW